MAIVDNLIGVGTAVAMANTICGQVTTLTAAGSTQATATLLGSATGYISVVSSSGKGVQLPSCGISSTVYIFNGGANTAHIYGQTGEAIGAGSPNALFALATKKGATFTKVSSTQWGQNLSA
jgi:hypothetical protein